MLRVLFVDDEARVLEALRASLRSQRRAWSMHFALGGHEALALLEVQRFEVIVSDLRMPGVDGPQVLRAARERQPWAARLVLSGCADLLTSLRTVPVAHQFLSKPCPARLLVEVIERAGQLNALLDSEAVRSVVGRVTALPSLPENYLEMQAAIGAGAGATSIARILGRDVAMCAKVLQLVNAAFFGVPREILSVEEAVVLLGVDLVRDLALVGQIFQLGGQGLAALERHSLTVAALARRLAANREDAAIAALGGMLHDLGKVVLDMACPGQGTEDERASRECGRPVWALEQARLGTTHAEVGAHLLGLWGLSPAIVELVAHHHRPDRSGGGYRGPLAAVVMADALAREAEGLATAVEVEAVAGVLGAPREQLATWRASALAVLGPAPEAVTLRGVA